MVAIVHQTDKRSGITYAYLSKSHWDPEKKQSRAVRTLIGRVDKTTGEIVPTDGRNRKKKEDTIRVEKKSKISETNRSFYGATYLLDEIGKKTGITDDLKLCFPDTYQQLLSIVYYLILEDTIPLYRFKKWGLLHKHPYGKPLSSQKISELFSGITEENKQKFFELQGKRRSDNKLWAYDTTSLAEFSETLKQVQYGFNNENYYLPQLNLLLVFEEKSNLPIYYRKAPGNVPDLKTVHSLLEDLNVRGHSKIKLVMDSEFYSEININELYENHVKFLILARMSLSFIRNELNPIFDKFQCFDNFNDKYGFYCKTVKTMWNHSKHQPYKEDGIQQEHRIYIHYYYNIEKAAVEKLTFDRKLLSLKRELETDTKNPKHEKLYSKYFICKTTPKRGLKVTLNETEVENKKRYFGFFALITNESMDTVKAIEIYRNKYVVEKTFGNLKERLNIQQTLVSSETGLEGKIFVQFIGLIYLSYINKQMQITDLPKKYTISCLMDKLDVIECFNSDKKFRVGKIFEEQKRIYYDLGVNPPGSL